MSLGLLGEYDSDSADSSDHNITHANRLLDDGNNQSNDASIKDAGPLTNTPSPEQKKKSYFEESFSGNSYSSTDQSSLESDSDVSPSDTTTLLPTLPLPDLQRIHSGKVEAVPGSVFSNPFKEEEDAKLAILKKHVTLAPTEEPVKEDTRRMNRRGRKRPSHGINKGSRDNELFNDQDSSIKTKKTRKFRTGLSHGLVPSEKYMKFHHKQQATERPWTLK